eukprot:gene12871-7294_t
MTLGQKLSDAPQISDIKEGKKSTKEVQFTKNSANTLSVALRQNKLQTNSAFDNSIMMESTERSPSTLHFHLSNFHELRKFYVKVEFLTKEKKNTKPEEKHDPKSFIAINLDHQNFEFHLETLQEYVFDFECTKTNKSTKNPFYKLRVCFYESKFTEEPDFIFESPFLVVQSKITSTEKKRKFSTEENATTEEKPLKMQILQQLEQVHSLDFLQQIQKKCQEKIEKQTKNKNEESTFVEDILTDLELLTQEEITLPDLLDFPSFTNEDEIVSYSF